MYAECVEEHFQIFTAGMQVFDYLGVDQQIAKRRPLGNGQRIDQCRMFAIKKLDQTELRIVGTGTDKFGIQGNGRERAGGFTQRSQPVISRYHLVIQIIISLVCAHKKRRLNRRSGD